MFIIRINNQLLNDDFRVYHNNFNCMIAFCRYVEIDAEPSEVVKHLAAHTLTGTRQIDVACRSRKWFQHLRTCYILFCIFVEGVHISLSGINSLHLAIIDANANTEPAGRVYVVGRQDSQSQLLFADYPCRVPVLAETPSGHPLWLFCVCSRVP